MEYLPFLAIAAFVLGITALIRHAVVSDRKMAEARTELAALKGWRYTKGEGQRDLYLLEGSSEGGSWRLEARRGGRNSQGRTTFACREVSTPGVVYLAPPGLAAFLRSGMGQKLAHWGLQIGEKFGLPTEDFERLLESQVVFDTADPEFDKSFSVLATESRIAQRLVTPHARQALLAWPPSGGKGRARGAGLSVTWSAQGFSLSWPDAIRPAEEVAAFAELGMTLLKGLKSNW